MRFRRGSLRPRARRAFSVTAFDCENRLESKFLTVPLLTRTGGFIGAFAGDNAQPNGLIFSPLETDNVNFAASSDLANAPGGGVGSGTSTDSATCDISTTTGPGGGSSIGIGGTLSGSINASCQSGVLFGGGASAGVQSVNAAGEPAALVWAVGDSNSSETSGTVTYTFQYSGTDGINLASIGTMGGFFSLQIITPNLEIDLNPGGTPSGLAIFENPFPGNPMTRFLAYSHGTTDNPNPDGSLDGVVRYGAYPGTPTTHTQGSTSFSGGIQVSFPIATTPGSTLPIVFNAAYNEFPNPGLAAGDSLLAQPSMQWTFTASTS